MTIWNDLYENLCTWDSICFAVNAGIYGALSVGYSRQNRNYEAVFTARQLEISDNLGQTLNDEYPNGICPHAVVRGKVKATGELLHSHFSRKDRGVILREKTIDHRMKWNPISRLWNHEKKVIVDNITTTQFGLTPVVGKSGFVDIPTPLRCSDLPAQKIYDQYKASSQGGFANLSGWLSGEHSQGVQQKEFMLKEGTILLGFGALQADGTGTISLVPPKDGTDFHLTLETFPMLVERLDAERRVMRITCYFFGITCMALGAYVGYRLYSNYRKRRQIRSDSMRRDDVRRRRRRDVSSVSESGLLCVICMTNRVEVLLLECGHLCLCADCCDQLTDILCPICRSPYTRQVAAYLP